MIYNLYTIYDKVAKEAGPIFEAKNDGIARRAYKKMLSSHPEEIDVDEYACIYLGTFDKEEIELKPDTTKVVSIDYADTTEDQGI